MSRYLRPTPPRGRDSRGVDATAPRERPRCGRSKCHCRPIRCRPDQSRPKQRPLRRQRASILVAARRARRRRGGASLRGGTAAGSAFKWSTSQTPRPAVKFCVRVEQGPARPMRAALLVGLRLLLLCIGAFDLLAEIRAQKAAPRREALRIDRRSDNARAAAPTRRQEERSLLANGCPKAQRRRRRAGGGVPCAARDMPPTNRGDAAATTWLIRGREIVRGPTNRGDAAATRRG